MHYRRAVFASPKWAAIRESTGERIEFSDSIDGWLYRYPLHAISEQFMYLQDLADWAWNACDAQDWTPVTDEKVVIPVNRSYGRTPTLDG